MIEKGRLIAQGNTSEIYEFEEDKILKLYRKAMPDSACEYEYSITDSLNKILGISPRVYEIVHTDNRIGVVFEKISGQTMLHTMLKKFWTIKTQSKQLAHYHKEIQKEVDFNLISVKEKLMRDIEWVPDFSTTDRDKLNHYIRLLPDGDTLCHFDFHPDNIILDKEQAKVIDWMTACAGDKAADIARTGILLKYTAVPRQSKLVTMLARRLQNMIYQNYIKEYLRISDLRLEEVQKWEIPVAAARLCEWVPEEEKRILYGIVRQYLDHNN